MVSRILRCRRLQRPLTVHWVIFLRIAGTFFIYFLGGHLIGDFSNRIASHCTLLNFSANCRNFLKYIFCTLRDTMSHAFSTSVLIVPLRIMGELFMWMVSKICFIYKSLSSLQLSWLMFSLFYADFFDAVALNSLKIICDLLIIRCSTSFGSQRLSLYIAEFFCELLAVFENIFSMRYILSRGIHPRSHDRPCPVLRDADHVVAASCARDLAM